MTKRTTPPTRLDGWAFWLLVAVGSSLAEPVSASCHPNCPGASTGGVSLPDTPGFSTVVASPFRSVDKYVLGAGLGYAFPTEPMKAGQLYTKLVPGIWTSTGEHIDYLVGSEFRGYLVGGSLLYGINDRWGVNFTGIYEQSTSGSAETVAVQQGGQGQNLRLPGDARGLILAVGAVYDPVAWPKLRLPLVAGIGYNYYSATVEDTFAVSNPGGSETFRYYGNQTVSRASLYLGISAQADYRAFRFAPFVITSDSGFFRGEGTSKVRLQNLTAGTEADAEVKYNEVTYLSAGITITYLPWNFGLSYIRGDMLSRGIDTDIYSLTWGKKW